MDYTLNFNDISIYSGREIQDAYNESIMNIFMIESSYFQDIIHKRNSGVLNESVIQESLSEKVKFIGRKIKEFFQMIVKAIRKFFGMIIDKIGSIFGKTKVTEDGEKIIPPSEKETGESIKSTEADINNDVNKAKTDVTGGISDAEAKAVADKIKARYDASEAKERLASGHYNKEDFEKYKKNKEKMQQQVSDTPKRLGTEKVYYLEKRKNLFQVITENFNRAVNWIDKNYKGEEKKFGEIDYWQYANSRNNIDFSNICNKLSDNFDINDFENYIQRKIKKKNMQVSDFKDEIKDEAKDIDTYWGKDRDLTKDIYHAFGIDDNNTKEYQGTSFETRMRRRLQLDNIVDVTNINLNKCSNDILLQITDKNSHVKRLKKAYNDFIEYSKDAETKVTNFNNKYGEYGTISQKSINNMLKYISESIRYLDIAMAITMQGFINRRKRSILIYNNVLSFYRSEKQKAE